jgi:hypothetical protein
MTTIPLIQLLLVPSGQLSDLSVNDRCRLAACPRADPDILGDLSFDDNARVRAAYVRNGEACIYDVEAMSGDDDLRVRLAVARRRRVNDDTMRGLTFDPDLEVRRALVKRPGLDVWMLEQLMGDQDEVVAAVARRRLARLHPPSGAGETSRV